MLLRSSSRGFSSYCLLQFPDLFTERVAAASSQMILVPCSVPSSIWQSTVLQTWLYCRRCCLSGQNELHWACRQQLMIPKVMETSDRQADNKTEREQVWEGGSVGALVKQDAAVLAWLFTLEKINMAAAHVFLDALFYAALWSSTLTGNSLRVKMEFPLHHCGFGILMMTVAAWRTNCFTDCFFFSPPPFAFLLIDYTAIHCNRADLTAVLCFTVWV